MPHLSPAWFSIGACLSYPLFLALDWHLFLYYPLTREWSFHSIEGAPGPAMQWYGLIASAGLAGVATGMVIPGGNRDQALSRWVGVAALASMAVCAYLLRGFFV